MLRILVHEALHMSSSRYDKENGVLYTGFDVFNEDGQPIAPNRGLTEGTTEILTETIISNMLENNNIDVLSSSGYEKEILVAKQMRMLCQNKLIEEYFNANGDEAIKDKMKEFFIDSSDASKIVDSLFDRIEDGYYLRKYEKKPDFTSSIQYNVQNILLIAMDKKIEEYIQNNVIEDIDDFEEYMGIFRRTMLLPDNIKGDTNKFWRLDKLSKEFDTVKEQYEQKIALKYPEKNLGITLKSPINGSPLERAKDGTYHSEYDDLTYVVKDGKIVPFNEIKKTIKKAPKMERDSLDSI